MVLVFVVIVVEFVIGGDNGFGCDCGNGCAGEVVSKDILKLAQVDPKL